MRAKKSPEEKNRFKDEDTKSIYCPNGGDFITRKLRCSRNEKCWKSRVLARWLTAFELSILFLWIVPSLTEGRSPIYPPEDHDATADADWCLTPECNRAASAILKNMDPKVDPCQDFYRYACGGFINETIVPNNEGKVNILSTGEKMIREQLKVLIEADVKPNERRHFELVKKFYRICMNKTEEKKAGLASLRVHLTKLGGWPVIDGASWNETKFLWTHAIYKFREAGFPYTDFINFAVMEDITNSTKRAIYVDQPLLRIHRKYLLAGINTVEVRAHYNFMVDAAVMLGADRHRALKDLEESLLFEIQLANIIVPDEERRSENEFYIPMTLAGVSRRYPSIPWKEYFERLLPPSISLREDEVIMVNGPKFFTRLEKLLATTRKRVQANYLLWGPVRFSYPYLKNLRTSAQCCAAASDNFPIIVSSMYVRKYFSAEDRKNVIELVTDIRRQFNNILKNIDWMDEKTRSKALDKAAAMVNHVGYPDELLDDDRLEKIYHKFKVSEGNYLENILNVNHFMEDLALSKLHEPMDTNKFMEYGDSASVEAYYWMLDNSLRFPAGFLRSAFFNKKLPNYMNYGAVGYGIGHEITHGFDDIGKRFDKNGNIFNWWESSSEDHYRRLSRCLIEQYANYTIPELGLNLNGVATQGENIADNGGIKVAYLAYKSWVARNEPEKKLPGIDRTPEQMFWLSAANFWCSKYSRKALKLEVISNEHSPEEFRILGTFSNMPEFANDFKCPEGSRMNRTNKCSIW